MFGPFKGLVLAALAGSISVDGAAHAGSISVDITASGSLGSSAVQARHPGDGAETAFCLGNMHSYIELPVCPSSSVPKRVDPISVNATTFTSCQGPYYRVSVHYNIPDAERKFLFDQKRSSTTCPASDTPIKRIGAVSLHPVCAWGILQDLQAVYENPEMRVSMSVDGTKGLKEGVLSVLARDIFSFGSAIRKTVPTAWKHGLTPDVAIAAADAIDWNDLLNCETALSTAEFMEPRCRGAVCWNQVRDFYHLYCSYWRTDVAAVEKGCSVEREDCCEKVATEHAAFRKMGGGSLTSTPQTRERHRPPTGGIKYVSVVPSELPVRRTSVCVRHPLSIPASPPHASTKATSLS